MTPSKNPFYDTVERPHREGGVGPEELGLANRNHGFPLELMRSDITPAGLHYLLIHFDIPELNRESHSLKVSGAVENELTLSLADLEALPAVTMPITLECAGNGRARLDPRPASMPWQCEAIGTAEWTGTPLRHVLERAGVSPQAADIVFTGADRGADNGVIHDYARSLTPEEAAGDNVLLVYGMNGAPLLPQHGAPLRLIVAGWYGMASVKWLNRIDVIKERFDGHQQTTCYMYRERPDDPGTPVSTIRVKSLMVPPGMPDWFTRERLCPPGVVQLQGRAWSGAGVPVARVEVFADGNWHDADLKPALSDYAWRGWTFDWQAKPGRHELMCRATDANGDVQPVEARWDESGLGNNAVQRVVVHVR